jgi:hypothetical protein
MAAAAKPQEDDDEGWGGAGDLLDWNFKNRKTW